MTFDKTFYEFKAPCEYLLAHDFIDHNFSLIMTKDSAEKPDHFTLTLFSNKVSVAVDMFTDVSIAISFSFYYKNIFSLIICEDKKIKM